MGTLIIVGIILYLYGWFRALAFYAGCIASGVSLALAEVSAGGLSYLFWPETVRAFNGGGYMVSWFLERENFQLWEAPLAPLLFFFDLVWKGFQFCWQCPNIFSIGIFGWWLYMMYQIWGVIVIRFFIPRYTPIK